MDSWIFPLCLLLAITAGSFLPSLWTILTRKRSAPPKPSVSSSALDVWRTEVDRDIADLRSRVDGLSSTLRRLNGRESMRSNRSQPRDLSDLPAHELKNALRLRHGLVPKNGAEPDGG